MVQKVRYLVGVCLGVSVVFAQGGASTRLYEKAQRYTQQSVWDSAILVWRTLLSIERDSVRRGLIYQQLGYIAVHKGDSGEALRLWEQALRYRPEYPVAQQNYRWLRQKLPPPPPIPPPVSAYESPPPPSEKALPHLGSGPPPPPLKPPFLSVARLRN